MLNAILAIEAYEVLLPLALILVLSKMFSLGAKKIGMPQVVGMLLAGILIGLIKTWTKGSFITDDAVTGITFIAEIGVILIMFSAGIETDVNQIKSTGVASLIITTLGVVVPLGLGFLVAGLFNGFSGTVNFNGTELKKVYSNLFYGVILTATSVSVTIATMKELGKLNSKIGTAIVSAAILDDIIGVIVLSVILSLGGGGSDPIWLVILKTIGFFVLVMVLGFAIRKLFTHLEKKYPHHRRLPIYGLAFCFLLAYLAERCFGIADITGAYAAGLILAGRSSSEYLERRTDIASYIIFTPVFFAKIGITTDFTNFDLSLIGFGLCFILAGILGKLVGCGVGAKISKFNFKDSFRCGVGMMCRAEVCLICAQKGINAGLVDPNIQTFIIVLIILTSFITPLLLKVSYKGEMDVASNQETSNLVKGAVEVQENVGTITKEAK